MLPLSQRTAACQFCASINTLSRKKLTSTSTDLRGKSTRTFGHRRYAQIHYTSHAAPDTLESQCATDPARFNSPRGTWQNIGMVPELLAAFPMVGLRYFFSVVLPPLRQGLDASDIVNHLEQERHHHQDRRLAPLKFLPQ